MGTKAIMRTIEDNKDLEMEIARGEKVLIKGLGNVEILVGTGETSCVFIDESEKMVAGRPVFVSENELSFEGDRETIVEWTPQYFDSYGHLEILRGLYFKGEKEYKEYSKLLWGNLE